MALHNLARVTSATTGTGTLTLGSAVSGFLSFADAGVANGETVTYAIRDGADSEIGRGVYTTAGTTLTRATIYESTNGGAAINCTGSQEVFVTAAAENVWTAPTVTTVTTTNLTATLNRSHILDVSGLTADRNFIISAGAAGDWIEVNLSAGDDTYELIIIGDTGISINGGSTATEWSRLFITGETVMLKATSATNWQVTYDGRIPCHGQMTLSANDTTNTANTLTLPTWDNAVINTGNICDTTNYRFNIRRAGKYRVSGDYRADNTVADGNFVFVQIYLNGTGGTLVATSDARQSGASTAMSNAISPRSIDCAVGDYLDYWYWPQAANDGISATKSFFEVIEV
jgi:hypothetical protein